MTDFGDWLRTFDIWSNDFDNDLANLAALLEEELDKRRNPGNPHLREGDHADGGGCPQDCLDFRAALKACKEFREKWS